MAFPIGNGLLRRGGVGHYTKLCHVLGNVAGTSDWEFSVRGDSVDFRRYARTSQNPSDLSYRCMLSRVLHPLDRVYAFTHRGVGRNGDKPYTRG
jgi:hypothetical protein